jgi:hypothetical protein
MRKLHHLHQQYVHLAAALYVPASSTMRRCAGCTSDIWLAAHMLSSVVHQAIDIMLAT